MQNANEPKVTRAPLQLTPAQLALVAGGAKKKSSGRSNGGSSNGGSSNGGSSNRGGSGRSNG